LSDEELARVQTRTLTSDISDLVECNTYIVTVPTPVTEDKQPDFSPLELACEVIGALLSRGDTVIFESTVYPGATEEVCVPILELRSGLKRSEEFWYGYSPERINPGDPTRRLQDIVKVVSGCCAESLDYIDALYSSIVRAGIHRAPTVQVAEAAKVIENTQRDVNIALINELAMLFDKLGLDTREVLAAAGTKWNFLPFNPGLVGGHCIPVDPYYLTHKAREVGFDPNIILAGRGVNDSMADWVAGKVFGLMQARGIEPADARVLVMGLTFKENCPDTRNSQVFKLVRGLRAMGCEVDAWDPWVLRESMSTGKELEGITKHLAGARLMEFPKTNAYQGIVVAVSHAEFKALAPVTIKDWAAERCVFFDVQGNLTGDLTMDWR
jgi:UDP-N-acetyl-D-galactosamine dehydrogenase